MDMTKQSEDLKMRIQARKNNKKGNNARKLLSAAPASGGDNGFDEIQNKTL